jgi:ferredoxin-like protein FixX
LNCVRGRILCLDESLQSWTLPPYQKGITEIPGR